MSKYDLLKWGVIGVRCSSQTECVLIFHMEREKNKFCLPVLYRIVFKCNMAPSNEISKVFRTRIAEAHKMRMDYKRISKDFSLRLAT